MTATERTPIKTYLVTYELQPITGKKPELLGALRSLGQAYSSIIAPYSSTHQMQRSLPAGSAILCSAHPNANAAAMAIEELCKNEGHVLQSLAVVPMEVAKCAFTNDAPKLVPVAE